MYSNKAKSRDICQYLMSTGTEIAMKYNPKSPTKFSIGDIVDCNYGSHLKSEISGGHVHSIICDIEENGLVYAVPITKTQLEGDETRYLQFAANIDVEYNDARFTGGTALLKMGRYIHELRASEVVGHVLPEFFHKLLMVLPTTINFSSKYDNYEDELAEKLGDVQNDDNMLSFENSEESKVEETENNSVEGLSGEVTSNEKTEGNAAEETSDDEVSKTPTEEIKENTTAKKISAEDYVADTIADALNSLDKSKPVEDQIDSFLDTIGLPKSARLVRNSFIAACTVKKVSYESIIIKLHNETPKIREEIIKATLKEEFKKWLSKHPDVKENYPKVSIMVLLKVFAKKMS